eukprot:g27556.t1
MVQQQLATNFHVNSGNMRCIECGAPVVHVYREFSKGNIRLTKCECCHQFADKYVEFEMLLIILDLMLQKSAAYRHLLLNRRHLLPDFTGPAVLKLAPAYTLLDSFLKWLRLKAVYEQPDFSLLLSKHAGRAYENHAVLLQTSVLELL